MIHGGDIYHQKIEYDYSVNISPLGVPETVAQALSESLKQVACYPDLLQREVREAIAVSEDVTPEMVLGGNGASELIMAIIRMVNPDKAMVTVPGFYGYRHCLETVEGCKVIPYKLREEDAFCLTDGILTAIRQVKPKLLILTNPNNPTGRNIDRLLVEQIADTCAEVGCQLLLDECFMRLSNGTGYLKGKRTIPGHIWLLNAYTKLFAIPGVRVGYVLAAKENIEKLKKYLPEWNMSIPAQRAAIACAELVLEGNYEKQVQKVLAEERKYLCEELARLCIDGKKIRVYPSDTNFILLYTETELYEKLMIHFIAIRDLRNMEGLKKGYYRIAVRNHKDNQKLIQTLKQIGGETDGT